MSYSSYTPWLIAVLSLPAAYTIIGLQAFNGTLDAIGQLSTSSPRLLPRLGYQENVRALYTGIPPVDETLTNLVLFFWNIIDGTYPPITLFSAWMAGQIVCVFVVTMLEGYRKVNHGKVISYFTIWGVLYQNIPWGVMMPIYYALHLVTSPSADLAVSGTGSRSKREIVKFDNTALRVLPLSVLLGCILPTVLLALPSPRIISHDLHQVLIALWQAFPVWVGLCQVIFTTSIRYSYPKGQRAAKTSRKIIHRICTFSLGFVVLLNAAVCYFIIFAETFSWDSLFRETSLLQRFIQVFVPVPLSEKVTVETLPKGCLALLQYDAYFACAVTLIWSGILYRRLVGKFSLSDLTAWIVRMLCYGPGGMALLILKSRDEMLLDQGFKKD